MSKTLNEAKYTRYENRHDIDENQLWDAYIVGEALPEVNECTPNKPR